MELLFLASMLNLSESERRAGAGRSKYFENFRVVGNQTNLRVAEPPK